MYQPLIESQHSKNKWKSVLCALVTICMTILIFERIQYQSLRRETSVAVRGQVLAGSLVKDLRNQHTATVEEVLDNGNVRIFDEDTKQTREVSMDNILEMRAPSAVSLQTSGYPPHTGGPSQAASVITEQSRQISNTGQCAREKNMISKMMANAYTCECENGFVRIGNNKDIGEPDQFFSRWVPVSGRSIECSLEALGIPPDQDPDSGSWKVCECGREENVFPAPVAGPTWHYWKKLREDPWYTQGACRSTDGQISMCGGENKCSEGYFAFHRRLKSLFKQKVLSKTFRNDNGSPGESLVRKFLSFMMKLLSNPNNRLILISVMPDHTFLVEQNGHLFRIYQSWESSFDLRYWVNQDVQPDDFCEPGQKVAKALQISDQAQLEELARAGIQDDRASIQDARNQFGGLRDLQQRDIQRLCEAISHGFILEEWRTKRGPGALFPASTTLSRNADTKPFLGKNVLNLMKLQNETPFDIEVSFMQNVADHEDIAFVRALEFSEFDDMNNVNTEFFRVAQEMDLPIYRRRMDPPVPAAILAGAAGSSSGTEPEYRYPM